VGEANFRKGRGNPKVEDFFIVPTFDGSEIRRENQLRLVVYPIIYRVLHIPGGGFPPTVCERNIHFQQANLLLGKFWRPFTAGWSPQTVVIVRESSQNALNSGFEITHFPRSTYLNEICQ